jgi:disulfide bond formation protein DsbB
MMSYIHSILSRPLWACLLFAAVASAALGMAFIAEYVFGLLPCILCVYQRIPYAIVIALGILGALIAGKSPRAAGGALGLISLSFLTDSVIAFYHSGVERHWWKSIFESCAAPELEGSITDVLAKIQAAPAVRCDEIPWADPIFGLSMANYNVVFCFGLAMAALWSALLVTRRARS